MSAGEPERSAAVGALVDPRDGARDRLAEHQILAFAQLDVQPRLENRLERTASLPQRIVG